MGKQAFVAILVLGFGVLALAIARLPESCPLDWGGAQRVAIPSPYLSAELFVDGRSYRVGGSALLDYMPHFGGGPLVRLGPVPHPLGANMSVAAATRNDLEDVAFTCVRVAHGGETWARRPRNYDIQSPQWDLPGESWRSASVDGGPEWPAGDPIAMEMWITVAGHRFVLAYSPFVLMKGG